MNVTLKQNTFSAELALLQAVATRKNTVPITGNVLIVAEPMTQHVSMTTTDLEIVLRCQCPATIDAPGSTTLPAHKLGEIVKALTSGCDVQLEGMATAVKLSGGSFASKIPTMPVEDFPSLTAAPAPSATFKAGDLLKLISRTQFAVAGEGDTRYFISGAKLEIESKGIIRAVATDGHRLSVAQEAATAAADVETILPRKTLASLASLLDKVKADSDVSMCVAENHIFFIVGDRVLTSRKVDGAFPAYKKIIPNDLAVDVVLSRALLHEALKRVSIIADRRVNFNFDGDDVEITADTPEGTAREVVRTTVKAAEPIVVGLNPRYVLDFVETCTDADVRISLKNNMSQLLFVPEGAAPEAYRYVLMPMR